MSDPVLFVKLTEAQKAILSLLAAEEKMDNSAFVRDLILRYCEDSKPLPIPWPAMPGKGGDRRSIRIREETEGPQTLIAYRVEGKIAIEPLIADNAVMTMDGYSAQIAIDQTLVYMLGDNWSHEDIERVRAIVRGTDEEV